MPVPAAGSDILVEAGTRQWGQTGSNGGTAVLTADKQVLTGDLVADASGSITLTLQNGSTLTGTIEADNTAREFDLTLDATSTWTVTADSYLSTLTDAEGVSGTSIANIAGNGHNVSYDAGLAANSWLGGKTYSLVNGGELRPQ